VPDERRDQIHRLREAELDVLVVGGGINGAGIIRDLALRARHGRTPLRIGLVEQKHFGSGTSGKNSQLIHGGLRYLKYFQLRLVRESLHERSVLLKIAPQFVQPQPFLLPMFGLRSRLIYGTGLWLYDRLAGAHAIARHRIIQRRSIAEIEPDLSTDGLSAAAIFYDCKVQSARFVVENILDAIANGAAAANYIRAESWARDAAGFWAVHCLDALTGEQFELRARKLVDARGAWSNGDSLRLVRGSHIVIPRVNASENAIAHFEPDGRIVFLIPWGSRNQLTLVGTTDEDHDASPDRVHISKREMEYLTGVVRRLFPRNREVAPVSAFSSLRPLVRDESASATTASRDHRIWNSADGILHIAGGKYTGYRLMSEEACDLICRETAAELAGLRVTASAPFPAVQREIGDALEQHLRDYLFVSTYLGYERQWDLQGLQPLAEQLGSKRNWDEARVHEEVNDIIEASQPVGA